MLISRYKFYLGKFLLLLADNCGSIYIFLKTYRVLCFTKLVFDQLPMFSPYEWPLSMVRIITYPYLKFWSKVLPTIHIGKYPYAISTLIGLETLSTILPLVYYFRLYFILEARNLMNG